MFLALTARTAQASFANTGPGEYSFGARPPIRVNVHRGRLTVWWGSFLLLWCGAGVLFGGPANYLACNAENLQLEDGSAKESYCEGISDFMNSGEPSEWTTPLPYVLPLAVLAAAGACGIWRRNKRLLSGVATVAGAALIGHVILLVALPG